MLWRYIAYIAVFVAIGYAGERIALMRNGIKTVPWVMAALCALFALVLIYIGHAWWFCALAALIPLLYGAKNVWDLGDKKQKAVAGTIVALMAAVALLAVSGAISANMAAKNDPRVQALRQEFLFSRGVAELEGYQSTDFDIDNYPKPYILYYADAAASDDNQSGIGKLPVRWPGLFLTKDALSGINTVIVAAKYATVGRVYEEYVNGVYTGDVTKSNTDMDLVFINLDTMEISELEYIVNGQTNSYEKSARNASRFFGMRRLRELYSSK